MVLEALHSARGEETIVKTAQQRKKHEESKHKALLTIVQPAPLGEVPSDDRRSGLLYYK